MRTEDDVREALVKLEARAPSADAVLRAVHGHRSPGRPRLIVVIAVGAAVAVAAGLVIALPSGPAALPSPASVGKAMLTSFNAANGDILSETQTGQSHGVTVDKYQTLAWPLVPVPGQPARMRSVISMRARHAAGPLRLAEDWGMSYTDVAHGINTHGELTMVCYAGAGSPACGFGKINIPARTWIRTGGQVVEYTEVGPGGFLSPASIAREMTLGEWKVVRRTRLDGQQAIELRETAKGPIVPLPVLLWVSARTSLPLRVTSGTGDSWTEDFAYLSATPASLALLRVPIPAGYPRSRG